MKLFDEVLLGHDHARGMRRGVESALIELAHPGILRHDGSVKSTMRRMSKPGLARVSAENRYSTRSSVCSGPVGRTRTTRT